MSLKDLFSKKGKAKQKEASLQYAPTMSGNYPFYSAFGDDVYASDIVMQSIRCKANEFKKLKPRHIVMENGKQTVVNDSSISKVLKTPNAYMTTADFLEKITILLELNKNVFIYPEFYVTKAGKRYYTALYPLRPSAVTYLQDNKSDLYISIDFINGNSALFKADEIIHWRKDYGVNDFFGGGLFGGNNNRGLLNILSQYDKLLQSISNALEVSCQVNGIMRTNTYIEDDKIKLERESFINDLKNNKSGILFTDMKNEYTPINRDIKLVDSDTLKFFYETILRANGTSLAILNGDYTKSQKEAYYEHALEGDIKSLGQAMSKTLFSDRELSFGNEIVLYPNDIVFMSMENKLSALQIGLPAGIFTKDEARELLGYAPLPNGQGDVVPQGYNNLLDEQNNNNLGGVNNNEQQNT